MEEAASAAVAAAVVADTEIVNPDGARDTSRRRGTTIRYITEPGAIPAFFVFRTVLLDDSEVARTSPLRGDGSSMVGAVSLHETELSKADRTDCSDCAIQSYPEPPSHK